MFQNSYTILIIRLSADNNVNQRSSIFLLFDVDDVDDLNVSIAIVTFRIKSFRDSRLKLISNPTCEIKSDIFYLRRIKISKDLAETNQLLNLRHNIGSRVNLNSIHETTLVEKNTTRDLHLKKDISDPFGEDIRPQIEKRKLV